MKSLRVRVTLAAVLVSVTLLSVVAWALYGSVDRAVRDDFDADLVADAELLAGLVEYGAEDGVEVEETERVIESYQSRSDARTWCAVLDEHGRIMTGHDVTVFGPAVADAPTSFDWVEIDGMPARLLRMRFVPQVDMDPEETPPGWIPDPPPLELVVIRETQRVEVLLAGLRQAFWLLGLFAAAGVAIAIAWQVGRGVRPILRAGERLASMRVEDLRHRLEPDAVPSEVRPFIEELNALLARLERGVEREREFSGHVAHELRTPLTVVRVGVEIAERRHRDDPVLTARLRKVMRTVEDMAQLIDNLLLLSRLERGLVSEQRQDVDLHALVDTVWDGLAVVAQGRGLTFTNDVPPGHEVHACSSSLQTIVRNLLSNAAAYTEDGGQIRVRVLPGGAFEVWDSGPQLSDEQLRRVFDRFWRADEARTHATTHAGIGLSLVRELAEALRLSVTVENVGSGGLRFLVRPGTPGAATSKVEPRVVARKSRWRRIAPAAAAIVIAMVAMGAAAAFVVQASSDRLEEALEQPTSELLDARDPIRWTPVAARERAGRVFEGEEIESEVVQEEIEEPAAEQPAVSPVARKPAGGEQAEPAEAAATRGAVLLPPPASAPPPTKKKRDDENKGPMPAAGPSMGGAMTGGGSGVGAGSGGGGSSPRSASKEDEDCEDQHVGDRLDTSVCLAYADLSPMVTNPFFPLPIGRLTIFEGTDEDEKVRIESTVTDIDRIGAAEVVVVERFEYEDDELVEWSFEYFAQAPDGTVCFLGEDAELYEEGDPAGTEHWRAGEDGAVPGIAMPADPSAGTWHAIGGASGEEDNANVTARDEPYSTPAGKWTDTVTTQEWNPSEPCTLSEKHYARDVGMVFDGELPLVSVSEGG